MSNKRINPWDDFEHWTKDALQKAIAEENVAREQAERERDEARPIVEAAMRQYEAASPCGWIGAWWLNPAFQTAAIQLHVTCEAAARAATEEQKQ